MSSIRYVLQHPGHQVPVDSPIERQLRDAPPPGLSDSRATVEPVESGGSGKIEPPSTGTIVWALPSVEDLATSGEALAQAVRDAGAGPEPLVITVGAADALREEELTAVMGALEHSHRDLILTILGDG
jgi:hypothetical protein